MKKCPTIFNSAPIMDIQQMKNTTYLEEKGLDGYISTKKLSRKEI